MRSLLAVVLALLVAACGSLLGLEDRRLDGVPDFKALLYEHACEGMYGDPVYGGNADGRGWTFIRFGGDRQPRGYTDEQVREDDGAS